MKGQEEFGEQRENEPFDMDFGSEDEYSRVLFPDDTELVHVVVKKSTAEVVAVDSDRDSAIEFARRIGLWKESTVVKAPFNPGEVTLPNLD